MRSLLLFLITLPLITQGQKGSIAGNIYWKYNNFVGNKPDAGAKIILIRKTDLTKDQTTADIRGDYSFTDLDSGTYLLIIKSKNTNSGAIDGYMHLKSFAPMMAPYCPTLSVAFSGKFYDSVENKLKEYQDYEKDTKAKYKKIMNMYVELTKLIYNFYLSFPSEIRETLAISMPDEKFEVQLPKVQLKRITYVTDFGITATAH